MTNNNNNNKNNDTKKITALVALIVTVMISTTSATYAYLAFAAANNTAVTGTIASAGLTLSVTESPLKAGNTGKMVPQFENALGTAINSTNKCVDANNNIVCKVYTITATSSSDASISVPAYIQFTHDVSATPNLKWKLISSPTSIGSVGSATAASASQVSLGTANFSSSNPTVNYYIVVWINEINAVQTDTGTWTATITIGTDTNGITSTITS